MHGDAHGVDAPHEQVHQEQVEVAVVIEADAVAHPGAEMVEIVDTMAGHTI